MTLKNTSEVFDSLNFEAKANLSPQKFEEFIRVKNRLKDEGCSWQQNAEWILRGWIWDNIENNEEEDI